MLQITKDDWNSRLGNTILNFIVMHEQVKDDLGGDLASIKFSLYIARNAQIEYWISSTC